MGTAKLSLARLVMVFMALLQARGHRMPLMATLHQIIATRSHSMVICFSTGALPPKMQRTSGTNCAYAHQRRRRRLSCLSVIIDGCRERDLRSVCLVQRCYHRAHFTMST